MKFNDARSFRAVVLPDYIVNPSNYPSLPDATWVYEAIRDSGCGIIKMPPQGIPKRGAGAWVEMTADQIQEYGNRGFKVTLLGTTLLPGSGLWLQGIEAELKRRRVKLPPKKILTSAELRARQVATLKQFLS
ncbi:MAG: hypothetical protein JRN24_03100 [Nitrososphaerota archaeon]|nr:hypothetical protein [Nitrososphaerota archaeon]